jgi:dihydroxy-acid dehydratase
MMTLAHQRNAFLSMLLQNGDIINIDVEKRVMDVDISDAEWARRRVGGLEVQWPPPPQWCPSARRMFAMLDACAPGCTWFLQAAWKAPPLKATSGTLYKYIKNVTSASEGCVTDA